jgi:hypothetical protein
MEMSLRDVITAIFRTAIAPVTPMPHADMTNTTTGTSKAEQTKPNTNLFRISSKSWIVTADAHNEPARFVDVDKACDHLMALGVFDEQIDLALIDMVAKGTNRANFSTNGMFAFSDDYGYAQ